MGIYRGNTAPTCALTIAKMEEIGKVDEAKTHKFNSMYVYHSVRKPGFVFEFCQFKNDKYRCIRCHRAGRSRCVTIRDAVVVPSTKHPEDEHICEPITLEGTSHMCIN